MIKQIIAAGLYVIFVSCNDQPKDTKPSSVSIADTSVNCYRYINNKDTVNLKTINVGGIVTGTLVYNLYEKDKNMGSIRGKMNGSLLIADYNFMSEGTQSTRQVAFKYENDSYVEGFGAIEERNGKTVFLNTDSLTFNSLIKVKKVPCE